MTKLDFVTRQLTKAQRKRFEHYVVNRIWTVLDEHDNQVCYPAVCCEARRQSDN